MNKTLGDPAFLKFGRTLMAIQVREGKPTHRTEQSRGLKGQQMPKLGFIHSKKEQTGTTRPFPITGMFITEYCLLKNGVKAELTKYQHVFPPLSFETRTPNLSPQSLECWDYSLCYHSWSTLYLKTPE